MERAGWIKLHRKVLDSEIWDKNPLYFKVFMFLCLRADYKDGSIDFTLDQLAQAVEWREGRSPKVPSRKVLRDVLEWLESNEIIKISKVGGGNRKFHSVVIVNYSTYQGAEVDAVTERNEKRLNKQYTFKEVKEVKEVQETKVSCANGASKQIELPVEAPAKKQAKRDDYIDTMTRFWSELAPNLKTPISLFGKWRSQFGAEIPIDIIQQLSHRGFKPRKGGSLQAYLAKSCANVFAERQQQRRNEATDDDMREFDEWVETGESV